MLVAGNHDHGLIAPWLRGRGARKEPPPLQLDEAAGPRASPLIGRLARAAAPATVTVRYPGVWLREDVYATHGHYLDCLTTLPAFERLGAGVMARIEGPVPARDAVPDDFEARLAPMYAWLDALAESRGGRWSRQQAGASASAWERLSDAGSRPLKARVLAGLFPFGIRGLNRAGLGPLSADISGEALRDAGLTAIGEVLARLGIDAPHVVFGHTHRAGPLPGDAAAPWRTPAGTRLYNGGSWIDDPAVTGRSASSPYWPGRAVELDATGPPRVVRIVEDLQRPVDR
ncbi:hypothetical protein DSM112329_03524 [Paraconexibacter sp. AEG42_29]|uniref:Calcineurin-like phosphoesterase domain-containing protein n=1 Tax=Paraconexibacter sp. AEG42_29 TaxID=2997339 RepID=A0AAU7AYF9_9ACTN